MDNNNSPVNRDSKDNTNNNIDFIEVLSDGGHSVATHKHKTNKSKKRRRHGSQDDVENEDIN